MEYVGTLKVLTRDCPEMQSDILKIKQPTHKKLISFSKKYHEKLCKDSECIIYQKEVSVQIIVEITGGRKFQSFNKEAYRQKHNSILGVNFYVSNPRFNEKWYFGIGYHNEGTWVVDSINAPHKLYKIPLTYNYVHPKKGLSPTFSAGMNIRKIEDWILPTFSVSPGFKLDFNKLFFRFTLDFEFVGKKTILPRQIFAFNPTLGLNIKL